MDRHPKYRHPGDDERTIVDGKLLAQTDNAYKIEVVRVGESKETICYLPKQLCDWHGRDKWDVPTWLAHKEKLI